jgi:hypothetical protein
MTPHQELIAYISLEASDAAQTADISARFPTADVSTIRKILGVGETISIVIGGVNAIIALLRFLYDNKTKPIELKIQQGAGSKIVVISLQGRDIADIATDISKLSDNER